MMKVNRYEYLRILQQQYDNKWEDVFAVTCDSQGICKTSNDRLAMKTNRKNYLENTNYPTRIITRREFKENNL